MAQSPEQVRTEAAGRTTAAAEDRVAETLVRYSRLLPLLYAREGVQIQMPPATDEAWYRTKARELIDTRGFSVKTSDGRDFQITIDDLNQKDDRMGLGIKSSLRVQNLNDAIPTRGQINAISTAVGEGVAEQTGSIGGTSLTNALSGFFSMIKSDGFFAAIAGVFNLLFGDGKSENAQKLKGYIGGVTADKMNNSVVDRLVALRDANSNVGNFLNNSAITEIGDNVARSVRVSQGLEQPSPERNLRDTEVLTLDEGIRTQAQQAIRQQILSAQITDDNGNRVTLPEMLRQKYDNVIDVQFQRRGWIARQWVSVTESVGVAQFRPSENERRTTSGAAAEIIADTISQRVTDPNFRTLDGRSLAQLSHEEYTRVMTDEVGNALKANESRLRLPSGLSLSDVGEDGRTNLDMLKDQLRPGIASSYTSLQPLIVQFQGQAEVRARAAADNAAGGARAAGTTGGITTADARVQTGARVSGQANGLG